MWQVNSKTKYYGNGVIRNNQPIYQGLGELVHTHGNDLFITRGQFNDSNFVSGYVKKIALSEESINDYKTSSNKPSSTYKDCNYKELHKGFFTDSILTSGIIIRKNNNDSTILKGQFNEGKLNGDNCELLTISNNVKLKVKGQFVDNILKTGEIILVHLEELTKSSNEKLFKKVTTILRGSFLFNPDNESSIYGYYLEPDNQSEDFFKSITEYKIKMN